MRERERGRERERERERERGDDNWIERKFCINILNDSFSIHTIPFIGFTIPIPLH